VLAMILAGVLIGLIWPVDAGLDFTCFWTRGVGSQPWGWSTTYWRWHRYPDEYSSYAFRRSIVYIVPDAVDYFAKHYPGEGIGFSDEVFQPSHVTPAICTYGGYYVSRLIAVSFEPWEILERASWSSAPRYTLHWNIAAGRFFDWIDRYLEADHD
jgi:hypothetical protein